MNYNAILLSGLPVSGKSTLCKRLANHYGWDTHSVGDIVKAKYLAINPQDTVFSGLSAWWKTTPPAENLQFNLDLKEIVRCGNVVADSRYIHYCSDLPALRVFVTADVETRARRHANSNGISYSPYLIDSLKAREDDEFQRGMELFNVDYRNPLIYHLILNSRELTIDEEFIAITSLVKSHSA